MHTAVPNQGTCQTHLANMYWIMASENGFSLTSVYEIISLDNAFERYTFVYK